MDLSVIICTHNRASLLDDCLKSFCNQSDTAGLEWELIVVDNNSTDHTPNTIQKYSDKLPLKSAFEPVKGHTHARNRGLSEASGELILWTDDDTVVSPIWLSDYFATARRWPDASFFGGEIEPIFMDQIPEWYPGNEEVFGPAYARNLAAETERIIGEYESPWGANFALRKKAIANETFRIDLGRIGEQEGTLGDESEFLDRIRSKGAVGVWCPRAKVQHQIPKERATLTYIFNHAVLYGREKTTRDPSVNGKPLTRSIWNQWNYLKYLKEIKRTLRGRSANKQTWAESFQQTAVKIGELGKGMNFKIKE
ncbi:MAG: glycosyltransferase [Verrucomicrobiota bacterium]